MSLPNNYRQLNKEYLYKVPIDLAGWSFFINSETPETYGDFANLILSLFDASGTEVISDVKALSRITLGGSDYRIYCEDIVITGVEPGQILQPVIYDSVTDDILYVMKCFQAIDIENLDKYVRVEYSNSTNIFNYNYEEVPTYSNVFYLDLNVIDFQPEYNFIQNSEATTGEQINLKSQLKDTVLLESMFFDDYTHQGMKGLSMHDSILLNDSAYEVKEGYKFEPNIKNSVAKGTITLYDQSANTINMAG